MTADQNRFQVLTPVGFVELPVGFQFPGHESKDARNQEDGVNGHRVRVGAEQRLQQFAEQPAWQPQRQNDLVRHSHDRKVLDRVDLRLDQQVDAEPGDKGKSCPENTQDCFGTK